MNIIFMLGIRVLLFFVFICFIQYLLSKKSNRLLGILLPVGLFVFSLIFCIYCTATAKDSYKITTDNNKTYVYQDESGCKEKQEELQNENISFTVEKIYSEFTTETMINYFLKINIVTILLLIEYLFIKKRYVQCKHMEISDL